MDFIKDAKDRYTSETPNFWKNMKPIMGSLFGGLSAIQISLPEDTSPWIKWGIVFITGAAGYFIGNFGTKNTNLLNK